MGEIFFLNVIIVLPIPIHYAFIWQLKCQAKFVANDIHRKCLEISCELSAWQMIQMKCQGLLSMKN